jgi:S-formylglutathione hydrolase FrmB
MAIAHITFYGESIRKQSGLEVIVPEVPGPWPVLYLLHGLSDDQTCWQRYSGIERYTRQHPGLMVVMPDGHRSFYVNDPRPGGLAYEDHIIQDVVGFVDRTFPTVADRSGRAIAGLSMGGYGATMLAMKHPGMFSVAASHSGAMTCVETKPHRQGVPAHAILEALAPEQYSCFRLARALVESGKELTYRFDCGSEDFLLEANRRFRDHLERIGLEHTYREHPGEHNWDYWDEHIRDTLALLDECLPALSARSADQVDS